LLSAVAYVALIAAAIASFNHTLASIAWLLSFCAICYAIVLSFIANERRRAMAIGFVVLAVSHVVCVYVAPRELPGVRLLSALGYLFSSEVDTLYVRNSDSFLAIGPNRGVPAIRSIPDSAAAVRTLNAVGTVLAGWLGAGIGALAYKHANYQND
jgi:hypothetical protein